MLPSINTVAKIHSKEISDGDVDVQSNK